MKRLTISIADDTLKKIRKLQSKIQAQEALSCSVSGVIETCCIVAIAENSPEVEAVVHAKLERDE